MTQTAAVREAADRRMAMWVAAQKPSPGKELAKRVAETWDRDGEQAARDLFRTETAGMKLWEQTAIADMSTGFRAAARIAKIDAA